MLIEELQGLAADPRSWAIVGLMALVSAISLFRLWRCPHIAGTYRPSDEEVDAARNDSGRIGPRFGLMMLVGAALTLTGLFMIAGGVRPTIALGLMVVGIVVVQTEPHRLLIRQQTRMVVASRDAPAPALAGVRDRLRGNQRALALTNLVLLAGLVAGLLAF